MKLFSFCYVFESRGHSIFEISLWSGQWDVVLHSSVGHTLLYWIFRFLSRKWEFWVVMLSCLVYGSWHLEELHHVDFHPSSLIGFQMFKLSSAACIMLRFHCNLKSLDHCRTVGSVVWSHQLYRPASAHNTVTPSYSCTYAYGRYYWKRCPNSFM